MNISASRVLGRRSAFAPTPLSFALALAFTSFDANAQSTDTPVSSTSSEAPSAQALRRVEVSGRATAPARQPGDRNELSLKPTALPASVQHLGEEDITATNIGRDISNVFRRLPGVLAHNIDQGETGNGFRMRGFATQGTHGADTAVAVDGVPQNNPGHMKSWLPHDILIIEMLTNLEQVSPRSLFLAMPLNIDEGSGSPIRPVAFCTN